MNKLARNLIIIVLLVMVTLTFSACCSARTMINYNDDGSVDEVVYITLDKQEIEKSGENFLAIKQYAESKARSVVNKQISQCYLLYPSFTGKLKLIDVSWYDTDSFKVGIKFSSVAVYRAFYGISKDNIASWQSEKHFLYTKMYQTGNTIYLANAGLYNAIKNEVVEEYPVFANVENELLYTYTTESAREHSDADFINKIDGKFYHTWIIKNDNLATPITIYYNLANRQHIILLCILISLLVAGVLSVVVFLKNKKNKTKVN